MLTLILLKQEREYTWQEISKHNSADSAWIYVNDHVYDVTKFVDRHPGGRDMILLMAGRDLTDLFQHIIHSPKTKNIRKIQHWKIERTIRIWYIY